MTDLFNPPRLLQAREVATYLSITKQTLRTYREQGQGPPFIRMAARTLRYPSDGLKAWVEAGGQVAK